MRVGELNNSSCLFGRTVSLFLRARVSVSSLFLIRYSNFIYTPGKHDFSLPHGRTHRFTSKEVVYTVFLTAELGKQILSISQNARDAVDADNWYSVGGRNWGSGTRNRYYGERKIEYTI